MSECAKPPGRKTFLMHVPKTGGITLSSILRSHHRPDEICPAPAGDGRWRHRPADVAHYNLFIGHFDAEFIDAVDPQGFRLTILRNPRDRIVSTYDFWRSMPRDWNQQLTEIDEDAPSYARSVTFSEFLDSEISWVIDGISNSAARQLLGSSYASHAPNEEVAIFEACSRLEKFDWFTTTDCLSKDLPSLASQLGINLPSDAVIHLNGTYDYAPTANRPAITRTIPTERELARIDALNGIDTALYRVAAQHRSRIK